MRRVPTYLRIRGFGKVGERRPVGSELAHGEIELVGIKIKQHHRATGHDACFAFDCPQGFLLVPQIGRPDAASFSGNLFPTRS